MSNILLNEDLRVKISDFGLTKELKEDIHENELFSNTIGVGSRDYMAPEILCGNHYTKAADIYTFGITMNELVLSAYNNIPHDHALAVNIYEG